METLSFFNPGTGVIVTSLPFGPVAASSSDDTMLRIANTSDLYQAKGVTVTVTGSDDLQLWLSDDGDNFAATITVGDIEPNGMSPSFWLRRVTASTAAQRAHTAALSAVPAAWTNPVDTSTSDNIGLDTDGDNT